MHHVSFISTKIIQVSKSDMGSVFKMASRLDQIPGPSLRPLSFQFILLFDGVFNITQQSSNASNYHKPIAMH